MNYKEALREFFYMKQARLFHFVFLLSMCVISSSLHALSVDAVTPINDREYSPAMLKLINNSQGNIKLMLYQARFYDKYPDTMSNKFLEALIEAMKRGVEVTAVIDISDWNKEGSDYNKEFANRLVEAGAVVYLDNPDIVSHQKVIIFDDVITVVGSTNWSYYALDKNNEVASIIWSHEVNCAYTSYFNKCVAQSERYMVKKPRPNLEMAQKEGFSLLPAVDVKSVNNRDYYPIVHEAISAARQRVWVAQMEAFYYMTRPGYAPDRPEGQTVISLANMLLKDLIAAHERGVDVRVVLDVQKDQQERNLDFANRLLAHGIKVFYDNPEVTTHAKMLVIDDDISIIGSTNWSLNAIEQGNEASVLIKSEQVAKVYADYLQNLMNTGSSILPSSGFSKPETTTTTLTRE